MSVSDLVQARLWILSALLVGAACREAPPAPPPLPIVDAGPRADAGPRLDAAPTDAAPLDGEAPLDAGNMDAGPTDAGPIIPRIIEGTGRLDPSVPWLLARIGAPGATCENHTVGHWSSPADFRTGFACSSDTEYDLLASGRLLHRRDDQFHLFVPDGLASESYPSNPTGNDEELTAPCIGVERVLADPGGGFVVGCGSCRPFQSGSCSWVDEGGGAVEVDPDDRIMAVGTGGYLLVAGDDDSGQRGFFVRAPSGERQLVRRFTTFPLPTVQSTPTGFVFVSGDGATDISRTGEETARGDYPSASATVAGSCRMHPSGDIYCLTRHEPPERMGTVTRSRQGASSVDVVFTSGATGPIVAGQAQLLLAP